MDICEWCASEICGLGRTYYDNLEDAMRAFGTYASTKELVRSAVKNVDYDSIWIPYSNSYIALGRNGLGVGWILRTVMQLDGRTIELPDYSPRSRTSSGDADSRGQVCTRCFIEMPLSGVCDNCD